MTVREYHDVVSRSWLWLYRCLEGGIARWTDDDWDREFQSLKTISEDYGDHPFAVNIISAMLAEAHRAYKEHSI